MRHRWERNWFLADEAMSLTSFQVLPATTHTFTRTHQLEDKVRERWTACSSYSLAHESDAA